MELSKEQALWIIEAFEELNDNWVPVKPPKRQFCKDLAKEYKIKTDFK